MFSDLQLTSSDESIVMEQGLEGSASPPQQVQPLGIVAPDPNAQVEPLGAVPSTVDAVEEGPVSEAEVVEPWTDIDTQMTVRRARQAGGMYTLPTTAFDQQFAAHGIAEVSQGELPTANAGEVAVTMEGAVPVQSHEIETGRMPEPGVGRVVQPSPWSMLIPWRRVKPAAGAGAASREYRVDEHKLTIAQLAERYQTHVDAENPVKSRGLSREEAAKRLKSYGPNRLTPPPELPEILKYLKQFTNLLIVMLLAAVALAFLGYGLNVEDSSTVILAGTLSVVIIITCTINYWHERQTSNVLASIKGMLPSHCTVVRDGSESSIVAETLVLGDVVHLKLGNRIPADIRLIHSSDLKIEMSSLTGESDAIECTPDKRSDMVTEARNVVFNSSLVMNGEGRGVVIRTGDASYIGAIAGLAGSTGQTKSSMEREVEHVALYITVFAVTCAIVLFIIALARGYGFTYAIVYGFVLVLVANVPEGLPTTVVSVLALTAQRMAEHHILIKRTDIIETLGAATVICTDKTGTLTLGKMTVENVWVNKSFHVASKVRHTHGGLGRAAADPAAKMTIGRQMSMMRDGTMVIHSAPSFAAGRGIPSAGSFRRAMQSPAVPGAPMPAIAEGGEEGGPGFTPATSQRGAGTAGTGVETLTTTTAPVAATTAVTHRPALASPGAPRPHAPPTALGASRRTVGFAPASPGAPIRAVTSAGGHTPGAGHARAPSGPGGLASAGSFADRTTSLAKQNSYASFYSFQGMTGASWARSNAFTRLITIAAICNRAQFSYAEDEEEGEAGTVQNPPEAPGEGGPAAVGPGSATGHDSRTGPPAKQPLRGPQRPKKAKPAADATSLGRTAAPEPSAKYRGDTRKVLGDASEAALLRYVDGLVPIFEFKMGYTTVFELPFNSISKTACAIARDPDVHGQHVMMLKGAPEKVLERCSTYLYNGTERPIDDDFRTDFTAAYERFALMGERVLGFAYSTFPGRPSDVYKRDPESYPQGGLVFCGLISLVDPPKPGVEEAIDIVRNAFLRVTMVTGDHPLTAESIARKVGIVTLPTAREVAAEDGVAEEDIPLSDERVQAVVISGYALGSLSQDQWDLLLSKEEVVFARTTPQQKLQIVEHYQRLKQIVAVTGDGTNDSPALKKANIGVAMGSASASDVAREAADILILDDNFASIVHAVEEGRLVYDNLRKTIAYTLAHATPELFPIFLTLAFGLPLALTGLLILTIDLLTEQGPAISLSYEPAESLIMLQPPRNMAKDRLVDGRVLRYSYGIVGLLITAFCLLSYFTVFASYGVSGADLWDSFRTSWSMEAPRAPLLLGNGQTLSGDAQLRIYQEAVSAYYFTLVACQAWHVFTCKTRFVALWEHGPMRNPTTVVGVMAALFLAILFIYISAWHDLFGTNYMGGYWFLPNLGFGAVIIAYTEWSKKQVRRDPEGWWARNVQW